MSISTSPSGITPTSPDTLTNKTFNRYLESINQIAIQQSGALTLDCSSSNNFWVLHDADITTLSFSGLPANGVQYTANLVLTQDSVGGRLFPITTTTLEYIVMGGTIAPNTAPYVVNTYTFVTIDGGQLWLVYSNKQV